jgi:hypothetical protein
MLGVVSTPPQYITLNTGTRITCHEPVRDERGAAPLLSRERSNNKVMPGDGEVRGA